MKIAEAHNFTEVVLIGQVAEARHQRKCSIALYCLNYKEYLDIHRLVLRSTTLTQMLLHSTIVKKYDVYIEMHQTFTFI